MTAAPSLRLGLELRQQAPAEDISPLRFHNFNRFRVEPTGRTILAWQVEDYISGEVRSRHRDAALAFRKANRLNDLNARGLL